MEQRVVTIIGGTGFVGRYVVKQLAAAGYTLRVISRHPNMALHLKTSGSVGQIVLMEGNLGDPQSLNGKIEGSYAVINLVGIMFESGKQTFAALHTHGVEKLAQMARAAGVKRFIHVSALGVDKASGSHYARSKMLGEKAVLDAFPQATILRPSVIFGPEDNFLNLFACMASLSPALPLINSGQTRFQPVYVGDVAKAVEVCLNRPDTMGQLYELGGPEVLTFRDIVKHVMQIIGKQRLLVSLPTPIASAIGFCCETPVLSIPFDLFSLLAALPVPNQPLLTRDQVKLLKYDNIVSSTTHHFAALGISPTAMDMVVPEYLARFHKKVA